MTENTPFEQNDDMPLGALFAEVLNDMDALAATITDTEIEARLHQLLKRPATGDPAQDVVDVDGPLLYSEVLDDITHPGRARRLDAQKLNLAWWEITVARNELEAERTAASDMIAEARAYREAAVEEAGKIIADARKERQRLIEDADALTRTAQQHAAEVITDAETLAAQIIGEARMQHTTGPETAPMTGTVGRHGAASQPRHWLIDVSAFRDTDDLTATPSLQHPLTAMTTDLDPLSDQWTEHGLARTSLSVWSPSPSNRVPMGSRIWKTRIISPGHHLAADRLPVVPAGGLRCERILSSGSLRRDLLAGLAHLYSGSALYGDLSPDNVVLPRHVAGMWLTDLAWGSMRTLGRLKGLDVLEHGRLLIVCRAGKVTVDVPLRLTGEPVPGALFCTAALSVEADPESIPRFLEFDIGGLDIGTQVHAAQVPLPDGLGLVTDPRAPVINVVSAESPRRTVNRCRCTMCQSAPQGAEVAGAPHRIGSAMAVS